MTHKTRDTKVDRTRDRLQRLGKIDPALFAASAQPSCFLPPALLTSLSKVEIQQLEVLSCWRYAAITDGCWMTNRDSRHRI